jgi:hypothetical protein
MIARKPAPIDVQQLVLREAGFAARIRVAVLSRPKGPSGVSVAIALRPRWATRDSRQHQTERTSWCCGRTKHMLNRSPGVSTEHCDQHQHVSGRDHSARHDSVACHRCRSATGHRAGRKSQPSRRYSFHRISIMLLKTLEPRERSYKPLRQWQRCVPF